MNELSIREENCQEITILYMQGNFSQKNWLKLESVLKNFLKHSTPEFVLLECSQIQYIEKECILLLQKIATLFSDQARELCICAIPVPIEKNFFAPPLSYCETKEEALKSFQKCQAKGSHALELTIVAGPCKGNTIIRPGDPEVTVGRHSKCGLSIPQDIKSSRFHCKVYEKNGLFVLEDLQSSNGTFFQDKMITLPTELKDGSHFQVGETRIQVKILEESEAKEESLNIPSLPSLDFTGKEDVPTEEANMWPTLDSPMSSGMEIGGMETVIGISLSDLLGDALKTDKLPSIAPKSSTPPPLKIPEEKVFASEKIAAKEEKSFANVLDQESWAMMQQNVPSSLRRRSMKLASQEIGSYKIIKKRGESSSCLLFQCSLGKEQEKIFIQYSKEPMLIPNLIPIHPHLLLPQSQGEHEERAYRVFPDPGENIAGLPLPEIKLLEIALVLADVLKSLHEAGISGFDLSSESIFYKKNQLPYFALIPAVVYEDILGESADFYSYGTFLFQLASGRNLPFTPIGTLDQEELQKHITRIPCPLWEIICNILKKQATCWDKISSSLRNILLSYLSPKSLSQKTKILEIIKMENSLLFHFSGENASRLEWKEELAQSFLKKILEATQESEQIRIGQEFYNAFYPKKIQKILEQNDSNHIVFNLDERLHSFPWEMAHNGKSFLHQKSFIERRIFPIASFSCLEEKIEAPRVFLISGHSPEELQRRDSIAERLSEEFPWIKIKAAHSLEDSYDILQRISQSDIVHISLPLVYCKASPMESGWMLDSKKILKLRFLENAPRLPKVLFHERTGDQEVEQGNFLANLYQLQIPNVIGTLKKSFPCETIINIYCKLLQGSRFCEAIKNDKEDANKDSGLVYYGCGQKLLGVSSRFKG